MVNAAHLHLIEHRHRVDGLGEGEHGEDRFKDLPVLRQIEIRAAHRRHNVRQAGRVDQARAEHRLFRFRGPGHPPSEQFFHPLLLFDDEQLHGAVDAVAELALDFKAAEALDRLGLHDAVLLDGDAVLLAQRVHDLL